MKDKSPDRADQNPDADVHSPNSPPLEAAIPTPLKGGDVVSAYAELAAIVLNEQSLTAILHRVAELAAEIVPGVDQVSVTLIEDNKSRTVAFSGDLAQALDERQYADGYGPCLDAALSGRIITIEDTAHSAAYPGFGRQAHRYGIQHTLSIPVPALQHNAAALNMYGSLDAGPFNQATHDTATSFAGYAAIALLNGALYAGALREVTHLQKALVSRAGIDQAKGILMRERRCTPEEAFTILREHAGRSGRKLRDVAQIIVNNTANR
jgi:GAF domain-containing protein